jgi:fructose 1,6-bisphosphate aldolase/phosphatase
MKTTISVIKADIGGFIGHSHSHPDVLKLANEVLKKAKGKTLIDYHVTSCGDDLELIMTHSKGPDSKEVHKLAWDVFVKCTALAKKSKLYGAGQDLLKSTFSGNVKGMGPGTAEMEFEERPSEPILVFMADKTEPGAWNLPLYKMFADPFSTAGLVVDPNLHSGFTFEVHDVVEHKKVKFKMPEEAYDMLALIGQPGRYVIKAVYRNSDGAIAAVTSTQRLSMMAGRYVGKDDPVLICRSQSGFPAVGEVLEPFAFPHLVAGWMRGSHHGPFMPVSIKHATPTRFDGPPRVMCAGFQLNNGKLGEAVDMFDDPSFDRARQKANKITDYMRRHGPFEPHRLSADEMEYTTLPDVLKKLKGRFKKI